MHTHTHTHTHTHRHSYHVQLLTRGGKREMKSTQLRISSFLSPSASLPTVELGSQDKASEVWCLLAPLPHSHITQPQNTSLSFGTYTVQWRRCVFFSHLTPLLYPQPIVQDILSPFSPLFLLPSVCHRASADPQSSVMTSTVTLPSIPTRNLSLSVSTGMYICCF